MKMWQWVAATAIGGISAGISIVTFLQSLVYTNAQGRIVENRVTQLESQLKESEAVQREDITHIRDKIDDIYRILIHK